MVRMTSKRLGCVVAVGAICAGAPQGQAQQAITQLRQSRSLATQRQAPIRAETAFLYSERWQAAAGVALGLEYTDNAGFGFFQTASDDVVLFPQADFRGAYRISDRNQLSIQSGIGYRKFIEFDQLDQFYVRPDTALGFDLFGERWKLSFQNAISYQIDALFDGTAEETRGLPSLRNVAGLTLTWQPLANLATTAAYNHELFHPMDDFRRFLRYNADHLALEVKSDSQKIPLSLGLETGTTWRRFQEGLRFDNSVELMGGAFGEFRLRETLRFRAGVGVVDIQMQDAAPGVQDVTAMYFYGSMQQRLADHIDYTIQGGRQVGGGIGFQVVDMYNVSINARMRLGERMLLSGGFSWQDGTDLSLPDVFEFTFYSATIELTRQLGERVSGSIGYNFITRTQAGLGDFDFTQNRVLASVRYRF